MLKRKAYLFDTPRKTSGGLHKPGVRGIHSAMNAVKNSGVSNKGAADRIRGMRNTLGRKKAKVKLLKLAARHYRSSY